MLALPVPSSASFNFAPAANTLLNLLRFQLKVRGLFTVTRYKGTALARTNSASQARSLEATRGKRRQRCCLPAPF